MSTRQDYSDAVLEVTDTGLSVAADLARTHGGQLTAASQPGNGTTMTLTLPGA
jgi:signal transduction histidine kinase